MSTLDVEIVSLGDDEVKREIIKKLRELKTSDYTFDDVSLIIRPVMEYFQRQGYCISDDRVRKMGRDIVKYYMRFGKLPE